MLDLTRAVTATHRMKIMNVVLHMVRYTIQRKRVKSLKEMKQRLEVNEDGGQSEE